jgi:hypothetical protein
MTLGISFEPSISRGPSLMPLATAVQWPRDPLYYPYQGPQPGQPMRCTTRTLSRYRTLRISFESSIS